MRDFEIRAAWTDDDAVIGRCHVSLARGRETISFAFEPRWLMEHASLTIDPDLVPMAGVQYPPSDKPCFGFLSDTAPDRWGRKLMERRELLDAGEENRGKRTLMESDYILGVHDGGRIGGIRFYDPESGKYLSSRDTLVAPPMEKLRELEQASLGFETESGESAKKWLKNLLDPGSLPRAQAGNMSPRSSLRLNERK